MKSALMVGMATLLTAHHRTAALARVPRDHLPAISLPIPVSLEAMVYQPV